MLSFRIAEGLNALLDSAVKTARYKNYPHNLYCCHFRMAEGLNALLDSAVKTAVHRLANAEVSTGLTDLKSVQSNVNR